MIGLAMTVGLVCLTGCLGTDVHKLRGSLRRRLTGDPYIDSDFHDFHEAYFLNEEADFWNLPLLGKRSKPDYGFQGFENFDSGMIPPLPSQLEFPMINEAADDSHRTSGQVLQQHGVAAVWDSEPKHAGEVPDAVIEISTGNVGSDSIISRQKSDQDKIGEQHSWEVFKQYLLADDDPDIGNGGDSDQPTIQELGGLFFNKDQRIQSSNTPASEFEPQPVVPNLDHRSAVNDKFPWKQLENIDKVVYEIANGTYDQLETTIAQCDIAALNRQLENVALPSRNSQTRALLRTALKSCSQESAGALIVLLMEHGVFPDAGLRDPLALFAVESENEWLLSKIIQAGGKLEAVKTGHTNPLRKALILENKRIVRLLLEAGVNTDKVYSVELDQRLRDYLSEFQMEHRFSDPPAWLDKIESERDSEKAQADRSLLEIIERGAEDELENQLRDVALPPRGSQTRTLLLHAWEVSKRKGSYKMLTTLFRHGASGKLRIAQIPMVQIALSTGDVDLLNAVLDAKGNPNIRLKYKLTNPVDFAIHKKNFGQVEALLNHGADLTQVGMREAQELKRHAKDLNVSEDILARINDL